MGVLRNDGIQQCGTNSLPLQFRVDVKSVQYYFRDFIVTIGHDTANDLAVLGSNKYSPSMEWPN